ncbi:hypothetical protein [Granulicatella adiacens]|uniref:hypothetical protein n=1 Tax=Granulicatella adiacens TaxID=46124 RepID=UPI00241F1C7F|nr:hypothetical protein [Granulicatella adiacens]
MKLFRKGIRQRRLTRMRELLTAVMMQNNSENELPQDGRISRGLVLALEFILVVSLLMNPDIFESGGAFILMGLFFPPFLLFGILLGMGTVLLIIGVIYVVHYFRVESYYQEFGMLTELAEEELSVYKQESLIPMSEEAERLLYYMEELRLETETNESKSGK